MKIFSASTFLLLVNGTPILEQSDLTELVNSYRSANRIRRSGTPAEKHRHHTNQSIREAIARMDPFFLSGRERFILNKLMRKGAHKVTEPRIYQAFDEINPTVEEMEAFTDLTQQLLSKATSEDAIRLALVGLNDSTVYTDGFFSQDKRLEGLRQAAMIEGLVEQEQNKLEHEIHLKMGNEPIPDIPKGKGMENFIRVDNMTFDQQYKIAQWMKKKPEAKLSEKRLGKILRKSPIPNVRELTAFHIMQQEVLNGKYSDEWTNRLSETIWKGLEPDPIY